MWSLARPPPFAEPAISLDCLQLLVSRKWDAVQRSQLVEGPGFGAFHARAVIAEDVNDQGVVSQTHVFDRFHHAADSIVGVFLVTGINFHLARINLFNLWRNAVPRWKCRVTRRKLGVRRDYTELFLPRERLFTQFVPALI